MTLYVIGFGGGSREGMTFEAAAAMERCGLIVGYEFYVELLKRSFPEKEFYSTPMRGEKERVLYALEQAKTRDTALVCSGDAQVYGMAGLALELAERFDGEKPEIGIVPGVTAALSGAALLGAPLTNDFAVISLSDLLTPWEKIEQRLRGAAAGDFVIALYNPSSKKRADYLKRACSILLEYYSPETVCGAAVNIGRDSARSLVMRLDELSDYQADMFTTVFVGNSDTRIIGGRMVTPRGYRDV